MVSEIAENLNNTSEFKTLLVELSESDKYYLKWCYDSGNNKTIFFTNLSYLIGDYIYLLATRNKGFIPEVGFRSYTTNKKDLHVYKVIEINFVEELNKIKLKLGAVETINADI